MSNLAAIAKYAKEHGTTYGKVVAALQAGKLTYEEMGIKPMTAEESSRSKTHTEILRRIERYDRSMRL